VAAVSGSPAAEATLARQIINRTASSGGATRAWRTVITGSRFHET
jgi:hypothetical protein